MRAAARTPRRVVTHVGRRRSREAEMDARLGRALADLLHGAVAAVEPVRGGLDRVRRQIEKAPGGTTPRANQKTTE